MSKFRERAFLVCKDAGGKLAHGPVMEGKEGAGTVKMPVHCPRNTKPVGVVHTHPDDDWLLPSKMDIAETRRHGLDYVCVIKGDKLKCFPVN